MDTFDRAPQQELQQSVHHEQEQFRMRMATQMFLIARYRREQWSECGRRLSVNQAAAEWIASYAADFPASVARVP